MCLSSTIKAKPQSWDSSNYCTAFQIWKLEQLVNLIVNEFQVITTNRDDISPGFYRPHKTVLRPGLICWGFELPLGSHPQSLTVNWQILSTHCSGFIRKDMGYQPNWGFSFFCIWSLTTREKKTTKTTWFPRNFCTCRSRRAGTESFMWMISLWTQGHLCIWDSYCHGYLPGCYSLGARVVPWGWCPLAGGNLESSVPLGACRQEGESLHQGGGRTKSRGVNCYSSVWR